MLITGGSKTTPINVGIFSAFVLVFGVAQRLSDLEVQLRTAIKTLEVHQKMFNWAIEDVGFIPALAEYHEAKRKLYTGSSPKPPGFSEHGSPLKDDVPIDKSTN
ncbi:uncharacterized protein MELLADRAFT_113790 [Melampsora larici-populina 98AG31]|uniref:Uncharacterized protein n=1 Tax=Melampsora larici-populina (strain 98AG31 / pathotype 3-4-7) TaxID=747676 RepID=F4SB26_MELLP|nr:uncharacterized protein MELLADRAFT_113790 [Melampsora larici-populina 98AG31]EGF98159.1 hypothetical protein MELLADRAFT_113790 [Melampsora larici-populina 98AG31]